MGVRGRVWKPVIAGLKTAKAIDFALSADELANQTFVRFEFMKTRFMKKLLRCSAHGDQAASFRLYGELI
jgi:hypothetical protein